VDNQLIFCVSAAHVALSRNSTRKNIIVLPDIPDQSHHPAATFVYTKQEFDKLGDLFSHHGLQTGYDFTTAKIQMLHFVILVF